MGLLRIFSGFSPYSVVRLPLAQASKHNFCHDRETMKRQFTVIAAAALATMAVAGVAGGSAAQADATHPARPAVSPLPGSAVPFATANRAMGAVAASDKLTIEVWLKPRPRRRKATRPR